MKIDDYRLGTSGGRGWKNRGKGAENRGRGP